MRLILEKNEIIAILGKHFDAELDPEKVIIRTEPLEIEVCGLPLASGDSPPPRENTNVVTMKPSKPVNGIEAPKTVAKERDDSDATDEPPPPGNDGTETSNESVHPASVLAASKELEAKLDKENPKLARRSGRWSEIAPSTQDEEI